MYNISTLKCLKKKETPLLYIKLSCVLALSQHFSNSVQTGICNFILGNFPFNLVTSREKSDDLFKSKGKKVMFSSVSVCCESG